MQLWTTPRRVDVDPWAVTRFPEQAEALNAMQRKAADAQAERQHGTEGCADTGDESDDFAFSRGLLLAIAATAVLAAIVVVLL